MDYPHENPTCEDCRRRPGGEVKIKRAGVLVWRRVLCDPCFQTRRENTLAQDGLAMRIVPEA